MKRFLMTMIVAAVFMATSAQAAKGKLYFAGNVGFGFATDLEEGNVEVSFDPGWNILGALGYDMGQFRVEGEIGYHEVGIDEVTVGGVPFPVDGDASALTFMANGYYDHEMGNSPLMPYVGLGLGLADTDVEITGVSVGGDVEFAYQFMVGAGYDIAPNVVLTGGYRFLGIADSGAPDIHEFNFGARFMF